MEQLALLSSASRLLHITAWREEEREVSVISSVVWNNRKHAIHRKKSEEPENVGNRLKVIIRIM